MLKPPRWADDHLEVERVRAVEIFREERLREPLENYPPLFDHYAEDLDGLLKATADLTEQRPKVLREIIEKRRTFDAFRYLAGPPISKDDLLKLTGVSSVSPAYLKREPDSVRRIVETILACIDPRRAPWIPQKRSPTAEERKDLILSTATLMAYQRIQTLRRNEGKARQEGRIESTLVASGFEKIRRRTVDVLGDAPSSGQFCEESKFGTRKADFIVGLFDQRVMPIECKVSNSEINSVKRLNNDAAVKAAVWLRDFGPRNVVPVAILSGVYKLLSLTDAQDRGLVLFWSHDLERFTDWILETRGTR